MLSLLLCRCEDSIIIDRGNFGSTEICGNSTSTANISYNGLQTGNFKVFFRTSESVQGRGFQMLVMCAASDDQGIMI